MKLKAIFHDAFLFLGIVIEGLLLLQTHIFMEKGKFGYMLVTGCLAIVPIAIVIWVMRRKKTQEKKIKEKHKALLRSKGITLKVDLNSCEICESKQNVHYTRMDVPAYSFKTRLYSPTSLDEPDLPHQSLHSQEINACEALTNPDRMNEPLSYERCHCTVKVTLDYRGKQTQFVSEPIIMDRSSLGVFLALQKDGVIYINPKNEEDYFFDLDFLKQE